MSNIHDTKRKMKNELALLAMTEKVYKKNPTRYYNSLQRDQAKEI